MSTPRILALMGSGETTPTMSRVHRELLGRLGPRPVAAVLLDTPYGFQENADEITARALEYFATNVGASMRLARFRGADPDALRRATSISLLREAGYVFSGPGSPSYALRQWQGTEVPEVLAAKLDHGGIVTFASAAALTLGSHTVPVYEIYKVGADPHWLPGLDILGPLGLHVAVVPHYDSAEGGTHDTRFCYLGEPRLARLELDLPDDSFVLGVDSHTALILDVGSGVASVMGRGGVTIRVDGRSQVIPAGSGVPIEELPSIADRLRRQETMGRRRQPPPAPSGLPAGARIASPLAQDVEVLEARFEAAAATGATDDALRTVLELEELLVAWSGDTDGTGELGRSRTVLHDLIVRLPSMGPGGGGAASGHPFVSVGLIESLIELRGEARTGRDWGFGDRIRDLLADAGIELRDGPTGTTWHVTATDPRAGR